MPVVAVLRGAVIGGGLELAAAAHIRVAERSAYYALPEAARGIFVGGGGAVRIPRLIGTTRMIDMMLTGRTYTADEGLSLAGSLSVGSRHRKEGNFAIGLKWRSERTAHSGVRVERALPPFPASPSVSRAVCSGHNQFGHEKTTR
jgi:1,4-dihydroxy-2-naphthoyl-CoA synthase